MEIGLIGLGKMGLNMARRLLASGHRVVGWNRDRAALEQAGREGVVAASSVEDLASKLTAPRVVWLMIPVGKPVDDLIEKLTPHLARGDLIVDGGNSYYRDSVRRSGALAAQGIDYVDAGVSGGVWGLELGYCMMVGGEAAAVARVEPALDTLAPPQGWRHVGPSGAGHYVKMVHNGIEYGLLQCYAEGFELLQASDYDLDLRAVAHLWNQASVVRSWILELAERAFAEDARLEHIRGWVDDSGMGRWTANEAVARAVPAELLTLALLSRFRSRQPDAFRDKVIAALRHQFGGHAVKPE